MGYVNGDPIGADWEKGASRGHHLKKSSRDLGLTPTEQRIKNQLMRQFLKYDGPRGASRAYREAPCWCQHCGRHLRVDGWNVCQACLNG